jgi:hypothetical protein
VRRGGQGLSNGTEKRRTRTRKREEHKKNEIITVAMWLMRICFCAFG